MTVESPPNKSYNFTFSHNRVKADTSPSIRKKSGGTIYLIWHVESGESYVGKTNAAFASRIYSHVYNANHPEKLAGQRKLSKALRRSPSKFRFRILKRNIAPHEVSTKEREFMEELNPSLNMAAGGGGGSSALKESGSSQAEVEIFTTPKRKYPIKILEGRVKVILTSRIRRQRNVVYVFKNRKNGMRLIGRTGQLVARRVYQYHWSINSEKSDQQHRQFVQDIKDAPESFEFGVLAESSTPSNLDRLESQCIKEKNSEIEGYNKNSGGGGSSICKKLIFR